MACLTGCLRHWNQLQTIAEFFMAKTWVVKLIFCKKKKERKEEKKQNTHQSQKQRT